MTNDPEVPDAPEEPEYLPISFLNALLYCQRRFFYEYAWGEMLTNEHVLQGRVYHTRADAGGVRATPDGVTMRSVYVYSDRLRISGLIDVIEAIEMPSDATASPAMGGARYPVEYKKGSARGGRTNDHVQLCAQGMCLEERMGRAISGGYVFSFQTMHRTWIPFSAELRGQTEQAIAQAFTLLRMGELPPPLPPAQMAKCRACSLEPLCLPEEVHQLNLSRHSKHGAHASEVSDATDTTP